MRETERRESERVCVVERVTESQRDREKERGGNGTERRERKGEKWREKERKGEKMREEESKRAC